MMYPLQCISIIALLSLCFSPFVLGDIGRKTGKRSTRIMVENVENKSLKIIFKMPAKNWTDALPIGNGHLGAMIHGGVPFEIINLNEDTLWTGIPKYYANPDTPKALEDVRKLVDAGKYSAATAVADKKLSDNPSDVYQLLGDIKLDFGDAHSNYTKGSYHRELDLDTATVTVRYSVGNVEFTREHFVSHPDQVFVTKISSSKQGYLSFTVNLDSKMHHHSYTNDKNQIIMEGSCPGIRIPPRISEVDDHPPKGIQFYSSLDLQIGGSNGAIHNLENQKLRVEDADWAVLRLVASSSFNGPFTQPSDSPKDPMSETQSLMNSIHGISYNAHYTRHLDDYQKLFHRVSLHLLKTSNSSSQELGREMVPTSERIQSFQKDEDPYLVTLLFQYGRYLLISSSRPGTQPANLQGIWNKDIEPPWDCAPHLNINLQMNYWLSLSSNLFECQEPLFDYMSALAINGKKTAQVNYGAKGWVVHQVSDIWAKSSPDRGQAVWALWPMGGAWLSTHLWEHYTYTMDKSFLEKKAYPLLEGVASFLLDWWIDGKDGFLETNPSTSPEHMFVAPDGKPASVSYSSTMDVAITKEVFTIVVSAAEALGKREDDLVQRVLKAQSKLPPYKIARDGTLMEWALEFKDTDPHHRHVSHLYGVFPGHTITPENDPDLCNAVNNSLNKRGEEGPGWSTVWKTALWAHLRDSDHAYRMVKHLFNLVDPDREGQYVGGLYSNLFSAHPPFQIDANFGFSAAVAEMLVQSSATDLHLLPALPKDKWVNGCAKGLKARGGLTIDICWAEGELLELELQSNNPNDVKRLHYRGNTVTTAISSGKIYTFNKQLKCLNTFSVP